jgi:hypothetical protein
MRSFTFITALLVGSSTLAAAQPWHHDRYDQGFHHRWTTLATEARLEGHGNVRIDLNGARLHSIELQALRGGAHITHVGIQYSDGRQGSVQVDQSLGARRSSVVRFNLGHDGMRGIEAIVVYGTGNTAFRVLGS